MGSNRDAAKTAYTVSKAQRNFRRIFDDVFHHSERILITRHGDEKVAVVPFNDLRRLIKLDKKKKRGEGVDESWGEEEGIEGAVGFSPRLSSTKKKIEKQPGKERAGRPLRFKARGSRLSK